MLSCVSVFTDISIEVQFMKKNIIIMIIASVVLVGGGVLIYQLAKPKDNDVKKSQTNSAINISYSDSICDEVSKTVIQDAIDKQISNAKPTIGNITNVCKYYLNDSDYVALRLNKLEYETQKMVVEKSGARLSADDSIDVEHFIAIIPTGQIGNITIKITDTLILTIERSSENVIDDEELINLAAQVVRELQTGNSNSNSTNESDNTATRLDGKEFVSNFFKLIDEGKASEAVMIMSSKNTDDDSTKQAWGVQFNAMESVTVSNVEAYEESSWTENQKEYKVTLNVAMNSNSASEPIPYYGYDNGENIRFIIVVKEDGTWKVDSISTGP